MLHRLMLAAVCLVLVGLGLLREPAVLRADQVPATRPAVDLSDNVLVEKALADQRKAVDAAEEDYQKKLAALEAERARKASAAREACIAALRRAESVSAARGRRDEALTIRALIETLVAEGAQTASAPSAVPGRAEFVGNWTVVGQSRTLTLRNDGTASASWSDNPGRWRVNEQGTVLEIAWQRGTWTMVCIRKEGKRWEAYDFQNAERKWTHQINQP